MPERGVIEVGAGTDSWWRVSRVLMTWEQDDFLCYKRRGEKWRGYWCLTEVKSFSLRPDVFFPVLTARQPSATAASSHLASSLSCYRQPIRTPASLWVEDSHSSICVPLSQICVKTVTKVEAGKSSARSRFFFCSCVIRSVITAWF